MKKKTAQTEQYVFGYNQAIDECIEVVRKAEGERDTLMVSCNDQKDKIISLVNDVDSLRSELTRAREEFNRMESSWRHLEDNLRRTQRPQEPSFNPDKMRGMRSKNGDFF